MVRGYIIVYQGNEIDRSMAVTEEKKQLCLVFGNPGKFWANIGSTLMEIEIFRNTIQKYSRSINFVAL